MGRGDGQEELLNGPGIRELSTETLQPVPLKDIDPAENDYHWLQDGEWFGAGGCAHLALAFKNIYPQMKIAVQWYEEGAYRRSLAHAVAWDPASGKAYDFVGTHNSPQEALAGYDGRRDFLELDEYPPLIAEHMQISWDEDKIWDDNGVYDGASFIEWHFEDHPTPPTFTGQQHLDTNCPAWAEALQQQQPHLRIAALDGRVFAYDKYNAYFTDKRIPIEQVGSFERYYSSFDWDDQYPDYTQQSREACQLLEGWRSA